MKFLIILLLIFFNQSSYANEYTCKCSKLISNTTNHIGRVNTSNSKKSKCISEKIILDYEDGYIAIIRENGFILNFEDIIEEKNYVKSSFFKDSKNYIKIYFNKRTKKIKWSERDYFHKTETITENKIFESITTNTITNITFQCS